MRPICSNCKAKGKINFLELKSMSINRNIDSIFRKARGILIVKSEETIKGRTKYWYCKECKNRWKQGQEVIMRK